MGDLSLGGGAESYYALARRQQTFSATANVTAPVIYTTAAGTGGPLLWNNTGAGAGAATSQRVMAVLLAVGVGITTASGAASVLGITGNIGQTAAPTATTAIDAIHPTYIGGPEPQCNLYRVGTVTNAGDQFMPTHSIGTSAVTAQTVSMQWVDLHGIWIVPPGCWAAVSAGVTATSAVLQIGLIWAEVPF